MSPKELNYIDDCLGHLEFLDALCQDISNNVQDAEMKKLTNDIRKKFKKQFTTLYDLLGGEK